MTTGKLTLFTIICSLFILAGFGHTGGPIGLFEVGVIGNPHGVEVSFIPNGNSEEMLVAAAICMLVGQLVLAASVIFSVYYLKLAGVIIMWLGLFYVSHNLIFGDSGAAMSLLTATPFLIFSIMLFIKLFKERKVRLETE